MMLWILGGLIVILGLILEMQWLKYPLRKVPGPPTVPFLGNIIQLERSTTGLIESQDKLIKQYGCQTRFCLGPTILSINLSDARDFEIIMNSKKTHTKGMLYDYLKPWLGEGLLTSKYDHWQKHRKLLTPAFHFSILEKFIPKFASNSEILANKFQNHVGKGPIEVGEILTLCTLDVMMDSVMGVNFNIQKFHDSSYLHNIRRQTVSLIYRLLNPWFLSNFIYSLSSYGREYKESLKELRAFTNGIIQKKKKQRMEKMERKEKNEEEEEDMFKKKKLAFLDLMLDYHEIDPSFTEKDIRDEADTFLFEGHDTTSSALSFTLYELSRHPEIQEQIVEELDAIFQGSDRSITIQDLKQMNYMERTIKEVLRLYPSVPFIIRRCDDEITLHNGVVIPKNVEIGLHIRILQRNPVYWSEPEKFDPDRFLPENCMKRHPYAYVPFSAGPRNCIGQKFAWLEIKMILATLLRKYRFVDAKRELEVAYEVILKSNNGIHVCVESRNS